MNPATILLVMQGVEAAIAAAPKAIEVANKARELIAALFAEGAISIEQQNALFAHIGALQLAAINNQRPPQWTIEADPAS